MTDLKELIERVEKATGPDRGLDADVFDACGFPVNPKNREYVKYPDATDFTYAQSPRISESIDAALALTERMLPGWSLQLYRHPDATYATLYRLGEVAFITDGAIERRVTTPYYEGIRVDDAQVPLAILAALLRALQEQEK